MNTLQPPPVRAFGWRAPAIPSRGVYRAAPVGGWTDRHLNVDMRPIAPPTRDQSYRGSCTGFAWRGAIDLLVARAKRDELYTGDFSASPGWIYYRECVREGTLGLDVGATLASGLWVAQHEGIASEADHPYDPVTLFAPPAPRAVANAPRARVANAEILAPDADTIISTLAAGYPIVVGTAWFDEYDRASDTGDLPYPSDGAVVRGGHALTILGLYRAGNELRTRFQNSWGLDFGEGGFGTIPLAVLTDPGLTGERITARAIRFV